MSRTLQAEERYRQPLVTTGTPAFLSRLWRCLDAPAAIYWIIGIGVLVRLIPLALVGGKFLAHENPSYDVMAWQLLRNEPVSGYWPPGLPYYLAFFHMLFGGGMLVARASILVIYIAFSALLYALLKMLRSRQAGNLAVAVFALYPSYIRYAFNPSTEYLSAACLLIIAYLSIRIVGNPSFRLVVPLGLSLGALALVRANSVGLAIVIPIFLAFRTRRWSIAAGSLLFPIVLISAWLWKAHDLTGRFIPINDSNEENLTFSNHPDTPLYLTCRDCPSYGELSPAFLKLEHEIDYKPSPSRQRELQQTTLHFVLTRPDLFAIRTFNRFRAYFRFPIHYADPLVRRSATAAVAHRWLGIAITAIDASFYWPVMGLAIVSCFLLRGLTVALDARLILLLIAATYALPCWLTWSEPRYAFPVIPLLAVFSFVLLASIWNDGLRSVQASLRASAARRWGTFATLAFFFCTQIEWIGLIICSNAMKDKWASISSFQR